MRFFVLLINLVHYLWEVYFRRCLRVLVLHHKLIDLFYHLEVLMKYLPLFNNSLWDLLVYILLPLCHVHQLHLQSLYVFLFWRAYVLFCQLHPFILLYSVILIGSCYKGIRILFLFIPFFLNTTVLWKIKQINNLLGSILNNVHKVHFSVFSAVYQPSYFLL